MLSYVGLLAFQSIFYGQVLQKKPLNSTAPPPIQFQSIFYGQVLQKTDFERQQQLLLLVSIHLLWTGTLEVYCCVLRQSLTYPFQSIFYGQVLQKDRNHRRALTTPTVSIHLLWTGTLEEKRSFNRISLPFSFNPSFMDRYFRSFCPTCRKKKENQVSIHLLWTGTLEGADVPMIYPDRCCFNPSFMDRYFRRLGHDPQQWENILFQSIFYGQVLQKFFMLFIPLKRVLVSIHLLWTGTLEDIIQAGLGEISNRFNPSFMDRYFRS